MNSNVDLNLETALLSLKLAQFVNDSGQYAFTTVLTAQTYELDGDGDGLRIVELDRDRSIPGVEGSYGVGDVVPFDTVLDQMAQTERSIQNNQNSYFMRSVQEQDIDFHLAFINGIMLASAARAFVVGYDNSGFPIMETIRLSANLS